ncbi:MAG: Xaa-Pro peptidase family protein [Alphaproteobacteria bacterium]
MTTLDMVRAASTTPVVTLSDTEARIDMVKLRQYRLGRIRKQLAASGCGAALLFDPINIRYATGRRSHSAFGLHILGRSVFIPASGPVVLFDSESYAYLSEPLETIDDVRPGRPMSFFFGGPRAKDNAAWYAKEVAALVKKHCRGNKKLALDRGDLYISAALAGHGLKLLDGQELAERARAIKSAEEILCMNYAITAAEVGMARMREALRPGITENQLWSLLHQANIAHGGEWIDARLMASGDRTNPWGQETSDRVIRASELVAFDCDMVGPFGYCADISRTWFCEPGKPTKQQRELYKLAYEEVHHNISILKPGMTFREFSKKAWKPPKSCIPTRYVVVSHGIGMCDEYPSIYYQVDWKDRGFDGVIEENMTLCIESYVGPVGLNEGVKLERQVLVTKKGAVPLDKFPFEDSLLA